MKKELRKVTNLTINELLNNEIIMPSVYFERFNKNARTLNVNLEDKNFNKELNQTLIDDFNSIESYISTIKDGASDIKKAANETKIALENNDTDTLTAIYKQMDSLEKEIEDLNHKILLDDLTNVYNRKWLYNSFLDKDSRFQSSGLVSIIDMVDYNYVNKEYGELIANNLLIFITNFIKNHLEDEKCKFKMARFLTEKFFIFIEGEDKKAVKSIINNIKRLLENSTLKSKSGLIIKANFEFHIEAYKNNQDSKELFETLLNQ